MVNHIAESVFITNRGKAAGINNDGTPMILDDDHVHGASSGISQVAECLISAIRVNNSNVKA